MRSLGCGRGAAIRSQGNGRGKVSSNGIVPTDRLLVQPEGKIGKKHQKAHPQVLTLEGRPPRKDKKLHAEHVVKGRERGRGDGAGEEKKSRLQITQVRLLAGVK